MEMCRGVSKREFLGELLGTFILVFFGLGSVAVELVTPVGLGLPIIALIWGAAVALAIHVTGGMSGAHLNPSITLAFTVWAGFPARKVLGYFGAQWLGAMLAAGAVYLIFQNAITSYEASLGITRGLAGGEATGMIFAEYFPNPGGKPLDVEIPMVEAVWAEFWGTAALAMVVFGVVAWTKRGLPAQVLPSLIGLGLAILIYLIAPTTQAGFNPARDLGPRIVTTFLGWGEVPFTTNGSGWFWVYVVSPFLGALTGGGVVSLIERRFSSSS